MQYKDSPLGKLSPIPETVDAKVLHFIERSSSQVRQKPDFNKIKIQGEDIWNCYEFSWLNINKIPQSGICRIRYEYNSKFLVESKSLKLYLAGFYNTSFVSQSHIEEIIYNDLNSRLLTAKLSVSVFSVDDQDRYSIINSTEQAFCIDKLEITKPALEADENTKSEDYLCSHIFRSICPVTAQPDWATIEIHCKGDMLDKSSLLGYLISFREHAAFHEEVCETIYYDLYKICRPDFLFVRCNYLRRGGIDINPVRYSKGYNYNPTPTRHLRQ